MKRKLPTGIACEMSNCRVVTDDLHLKGSETSHWSGHLNQRHNKHSGSM